MKEKKRREKLVDKYLTKMFTMVGEKYPNPELTKHSDWYQKRSWSGEKEEEFRVWLTKEIKKDLKYLTPKGVDFEVGMFILNWGWTTK